MRKFHLRILILVLGLGTCSSLAAQEAGCPPDETGYIIERVKNDSSKYYLSWNGGDFAECRPLSGLLRLKDPAWKCGDKYFNLNFTYVFTKSGGELTGDHYESKVESSTLSKTCQVSGNEYALTLERIVGFSIMLASERFALKHVIITRAIRKKILF